MDHDHANSPKNSDTGYLTGTHPRYHPEILPKEFSMRSENSEPTLMENENGLLLNINDQLNVLESEKDTDKFNALVERCIQAIQTMKVDDEKSDNAARRYLVDVAQIVHSIDFDLDEFTQRFDHQKKATQANRRNPYLFVIKCLGGADDIQRASNQSLALAYAVRRCLEENREISTCFKNLSIRECLKLYRLEKQKEHKNNSSSGTTKVKIEGVPAYLLGRGKVLVELEFDDKGGRFICELDL